MKKRILAINAALRWVGAAGVAGAFVYAAGLVDTPTAQACGGFFCSQSAPVEQTAEEIIFVDNPDDTVTAVIRIQYQGPSEKFAWVLPVSGVPDVGVSSNMAFDRLRANTAPQYSVNTTVEGVCKQQTFNNTAPGFPTSGMSGGVATPGAAPQVDADISVLDSGSVGPYDYKVIAVNPALQDKAEEAVMWLKDNGYDVTGVGPDLLRPYLEDGLNLLAFRLTKGAGADVGSIRPVMLTYPSELASIPIRPTAVAAQNDMGVLVWVLGDVQSIPNNYKSLVLNEARINWFNFQPTYRSVITEAADDSGGQGFVTEMAQSTGMLKSIVFPDFEQQNWVSFSRRQFADGFDMMQQASDQFRSYDGWKEAICKTVDPALLLLGVTCEQFGRTPDTYRGQVQIDQVGFLRNLYEGVIQPLIKTQALLDGRPYFTRMFSTMSADEMTMDPSFDFNSDLADVSNLHVAEQVIQCNANVYQYEAPWRIELPQGGVIVGKGGNGVWPTEFEDLPANRMIVQLGTSGAGKIVEDNSELIDNRLFLVSKTASTGMATPKPPTVGVPIGGMIPAPTSTDPGTKNPMGTAGTGEPMGVHGSDCAVSQVGTSHAPAALSLFWLGLGALVMRRRRA